MDWGKKVRWGLDLSRCAFRKTSPAVVPLLCRLTEYLSTMENYRGEESTMVKETEVLGTRVCPNIPVRVRPFLRLVLISSVPTAKLAMRQPLSAPTATSGWLFGLCINVNILDLNFLACK